MHLKEYEYTPILGWSVSRYSTFSVCKRRYFYQYYQKFVHKDQATRVALLRELTTIPMETGAIVHHVVAQLLRRLISRPEPIDNEGLFKYAQTCIEERIQLKKFAEILYQEKQQITLDDFSITVKACLTNFLDSERYKVWLMHIALDYREKWVIEPHGYGETRLNGLKLYCKADFIFPIDDQIFILDWKTGKREPAKHSLQLTAYSTWVSTVYNNQAYYNIHAIGAYLQPSYLEFERVINDSEIQQFSIVLENQTKEMHAYCADIQNNLPLPIERFEKIKDERICRYCNYKNLCYPSTFPVALEEYS